MTQDTRTLARTATQEIKTLAPEIDALSFDPTPAGLEEASALLAELVQEKEKVDATRRRATDPLNKSLKEINGWFKPALDAYKDIESELRCKIINTRSRLRATAERALRDVEKAYKAGDEEAVTEALEVHNRLAPGIDVVPGLTFSQHWDFEVEDISKIPAEFLRVDSVKLKSHIRATHGQEEIPGVTIKQLERVSRAKGK